jgi:hypothetical protein
MTASVGVGKNSLESKTKAISGRRATKGNRTIVIHAFADESILKYSKFNSG